MPNADALGELADLGKAVGLIKPDGVFEPGWFAEPGKFAGGTLRNKDQRAALLRLLDTLLGEGENVVDEQGRTWVPVIERSGLTLYLVVEPRASQTTAGKTETILGVGVRHRTTEPESTTELLVPLLRIPEGEKVEAVPGTSRGRIRLRTDVGLDAGSGSNGGPSLKGLAFDADVAANGDLPKLSVLLRGLQLPGQAAPQDLKLDATTSPQALGDQALRIVLGLVQSAAPGAAGPLAGLLGLLGLGGDAPASGAAAKSGGASAQALAGVPDIPALPVGDILQRRPNTWRDWLTEMVTDPATLSAWLERLAALIGPDTTVIPPAGPDEPHRVRWTLPSVGVVFDATVRIAKTTAGGVLVELGGAARLPVAGPPVAGLELTTTIVRIALDAVPSVVALPRLDLLARLGPESGGTPLVDRQSDPKVRARSLRVGFALDAARRPTFVLAAHDVLVVDDTYPVLDLTNTDALADVGDNALEAIAGQLLDLLGAAEAPVRVLLGLSAPTGSSDWPVALTTLPEILTNPVAAVLGYHDRVLRTHRAGYPSVLLALAELLAATGAGGGTESLLATGEATSLADDGDVTGTATSPWKAPLGEGLALTAWHDDELHLGVLVERSITDLGEGCPTVAFDLVAELARVRLDASGGQIIPSARATLSFGARGGEPLRIGVREGALVADRLGVTLRWAAGDRLRADLVAPGLRSDIDGEQTPLALPTVGADGELDGEVPWRALELLTGHLLRRTGLPWATSAVDLLGWLPRRLGDPSSEEEGLPLERLAADPVGALRDFAVGTALPDFVEWLALVLTGPVREGLGAGLTSGRGTAADPLVVPLTTTGPASPRSAQVLVWSRAGRAQPVEPFRPPVLLRWLSAPPGTVSPPTTTEMAAALEHAAANGPTAADAMAGRAPLPAGLAALAARWADTDGFVTAQSAVLPTATLHDLPGVGHFDLPAAFDLAAVLGVAPGPRVVFVTGPLGPARWPGVPDEQVLDLTAPGLPAIAFDVSAVAGRDGPWHVRLPTRAASVSAPGEDGEQARTTRLAVVVDALAARPGGGPLVIVGHGSAGHSAARAAARPGVTHLVTVGTPHNAGGVSLDILETQPGADTVQLLGALLPPRDPDRPEHDAVVLGRGLLAPLQAAYDAATPPLDDLTPPTVAPNVPTTVAVHCVRGRADGTTVATALTGLIVRGLQEAYEADAKPPLSATLRTGVGAALGIRLAPPVAAGAVRVRTQMDTLLPGPGTPSGAGRGVRVRVEIDRAGGWLAGGPDPSRPEGAPRSPSLRRAALELDLAAGAGPSTARIVLHDGEALGIRRRRWEIAQAADPLLPESRTLIGALAEALGPLPATGPVRDLVDLLAAAGLTEPGTSSTTSAPVSLSVEGVRRLLIDPRGLVAEASPPALAKAVAKLLGTSPPPPTAPTFVGLDVDGVRVTADLASRTLGLSTVGAGLALAAGTKASASIQLHGDGRITGTGRIELPAGAALELAASPPSVRLRLSAASGLPAEVELYPAADGAGLARVVAALAPAEALWAGITFLRSLNQPGVAALVEPLLGALGLLRQDGSLRVPVGLLAEPARWLTGLAPKGTGRVDAGAIGGGSSGSALVGLLDAVGQLVGIPSAGPGTWQLPYGFQLSTAPVGGRVAVTLSLPRSPSGAALELSGLTASLLVGVGQQAVPQLGFVLARPGGAGRITVATGAAGVSARLNVPAAGIDIGLVPPGAGLAGTIADAATRALPLVLDAIVETGSTVGLALRDLGDALELRSGTPPRFDAAKLGALGADPGPQLAQRINDKGAVALTALRELIKPAVPAGLSLSSSDAELVLERPNVLAMRLSAAAGLRITVSLKNGHPFPGTTLAGDMTVDATGLSVANLSFGVPQGTTLDLGPLRLAPRVDVAAGSTGTRKLAVGLVTSGSKVLQGVWRPGPPSTFTIEAEGGDLAAVASELLLVLGANLALSTPQVKQLLQAKAVGNATLQSLLTDVVLTSTGTLDVAALNPANTFDRLLRLGAKVAGQTPALVVEPLTVKLTSTPANGATVLGVAVSLAPGERFDLVNGDITVQAEVDASWIDGGTEGLTVDLLKIDGTNKVSATFGLGVRGLGLRLGRRTGPLLDTFVTADSVAVHGLVVAGPSGVSAAGGQLELTGLQVPVGKATGGGNPVASGVLRDSASGSNALAPSFSPALSLQRAGQTVKFDLRAGSGSGPWFIPIQRGFGPVYVEQVGLGVDKTGQQLTAVRVLVDGKVEMLGLTMAVDDLGLKIPWPTPANKTELWSAANWSVDLAGLAVAASTGGVNISGGLRRQPGTGTNPAPPDYVGMIALRFGPYGLSAYGGYGVIPDGHGGQFTSLFIYGALNAPIGGPPAFFLTGIGAGVGINRRLVMPSSLGELPTYTLVRALDPQAPLLDPMVALDQMQDEFPPERGAFWFAAGVSFTSFALVDCVAVLGVAVADGLEINLLGLARAALPTTAAPLAQVELALLARFSTREGVLWVQAQLTDNSWLLTPDVRLTGGFAFVSWFKGPHKGEFVLSIGGFHPSFQREGYPVLPRVGYRWGVSDILVVKGETYFALTSEAIMAGTRFEASLKAGPLWAYLRMGGDGIIFFDPFHFEISAYAEIGAGITIDLDLFFFHIRLTIAFHLHADVLVAGPNLHGTATIDLGVASATIAFGDTEDHSTDALDWDSFRAKYLESGGARVLTVVAGRGQMPPSVSRQEATAGRERVTTRSC